AIGAAVALLAAGVLPLPRVVRGGLALAAGLVPLVSLPMGMQGALALTLLPGALLTRAKNPTSQVARLVALAGAVFVVLYLVPQTRALLASFRGEEITPTLVAEAGSIAVLALFVLMGLLAVVPRRCTGGAVLWASLMLLWQPACSLVRGWWAHSFGTGLAAGVIVLACAIGAALGLSDLSGGETPTLEM